MASKPTRKTAPRTQSRSADAPGHAELLRMIPPAGECIEAAAGISELADLGRGYLKMLIIQAQENLRAEILRGAPSANFAAPSSEARPFSREAITAETHEKMTAEILRRAAQAAREDAPNLRPVVNATGVVLHTNLGRALLPEPAVDAIVQAARSAIDLEYDLDSGGRGDRDALVEHELCALTGAEAATVVNNNAAAVLLMLSTLAAGREVVISRGELVEIGGAFRIPDVMTRAGARLREVGTTNRTHPRDYEDAIGPETALLMKVHPSNYRVLGFTSEVALEDLVALGCERGIDVVEDLGSGAMIDLAEFGLPGEPVVADRIAAGASLVTFSGDKLLGGPQAGVIVGRRDLIAKLKANPLKRALRCDKLTLAALRATLGIYLRSRDIAGEIPTLRLMRRGRAELRTVAEAARAILSDRLRAPYEIAIVDAESEAGSGAMPARTLESVALRITHPRLEAGKIAAMFRRARIIGRVTKDGYMLDMRTIEDPSVFAVDLEIPA